MEQNRLKDERKAFLHEELLVGCGCGACHGYFYRGILFEVRLEGSGDL